MLGGGLDGGNHRLTRRSAGHGQSVLDLSAGYSLIAHLECEIKAKKNSNRVVWQDNPEETGYRIYRNGEQIVELAANITKYNDDAAPVGEELFYEIEAFTVDAVSDRVGASACLRANSGAVRIHVAWT